MDYEKLHQDTINKLQHMVNSGKITAETARGICADFVPESEDVKIRKALIRFHKSTIDVDEIKGADILAWLEKQGEKVKPIECFDTEFERQVSYLIASAMNKDYEYTKDFVKWTSEGLLNYAKHELDKQGGQKPADKVEPKFKVGDEIKTANEESLTITKIDEKGYWSEDLFICGFDDAAKWELVEQKPAWSEEDEETLNTIINHFKIDIECTDEDDIIKWLKSLKDRYTWKPSEEQIQALEYQVHSTFEGSWQYKASKELLEQLKKL